MAVRSCLGPVVDSEFKPDIGNGIVQRGIRYSNWGGQPIGSGKHNGLWRYRPKTWHENKEYSKKLHFTYYLVKNDNCMASKFDSVRDGRLAGHTGAVGVAQSTELAAIVKLNKFDDP